MKYSLLLTLLLSGLQLIAGAQQIKVYQHARTAIAAAKEENKMIVFFLHEPRVKQQKEVEAFLQEEIFRLEGNFIYVKSNVGMEADRALFSSRFEQDVNTLPIAVVSDATGKALSSYAGTKPLEFEKMLLKAHLVSGKIKDPLELAAIKDRIRNAENRSQRISDSIMAPLADEVKKKRHALSPLREWKKKDGDTFKAILLEGQGTMGLFLDEQGDELMVEFKLFSPEDISYLQTILSVAK